MTEIEVMRKRLRIKTNILDVDIEQNIQSAIAEMRRVGIAVTDLSNPLIFTCAEFYCKWLMGFEGDGEKYEKAFEKVRDALSLSGEYTNETDKQKTGGVK
ncbi:MAG: hypothetical protein MR704_21875 [Clostridia bacterium]|nr:hypothetical protein [Clostridia bacterium]